MTLIYGQAPNDIILADSDASTAWHTIATDGTYYTTLAALRAAGKQPFPYAYSGQVGIELGTQFQNCAVEGYDGPESTGLSSLFFIAFNLTTAPGSDVTGIPVAPGKTMNFTRYFWNIWIRKTVTTDVVNIYIGY